MSSGAHCNTNLIYDVGAHTGEDTNFYLKKGFSVVAIEPNPAHAAHLRTRFSAEIGSGRLTVVEAAIAKTDGTVELFLNQVRSGLSTTDRECAEGYSKRGFTSEVHEVQAVRFESVLSEYGVPYYMKVDIEGEDILCLEALRAFAQRPKYISIESEKSQWSRLLYEFELFNSLGYDSFKIVDQKTVSAQSPPLPALEGNYIPYAFERGVSSGLFGKEVPGRWLNKIDAVKAYRWTFLSYRLLKENAFGRRVKKLPILRKYVRRFKPSWFDVHARLGEIQ